MRVFVGLSGGVDSSVAALLLKKQGYDVVGGTMSIWGKNGITHVGHKDACYGPDEKESIEEAAKIAEQIGIPYHVFDCVEQYEEIVLKNFKSEYVQGRTPNPCVWCNAFIKFGALPQVARATGLEFDKFATGHYARIVEENGIYLLKRGVDPKKDQSYFLHRLKQDQLSGIMLPLGGYTKEEIRKIALENNLLAAEKPDSQDFYGGDYNELLDLKPKIGNIVDTEGKVLGQHQGIWNYTVGQRKGIGIASTEALYVIKLNKDTNEVVVGHLDKTFKKELTAVNMNWIFPKECGEFKAQVKIRSTQQPVNAMIVKKEDNTTDIIFDDYQKSIAIGQSAVIYSDDTVLGGGIIDSVR